MTIGTKTSCFDIDLYRIYFKNMSHGEMRINIMGLVLIGVCKYMTSAERSVV